MPQSVAGRRTSMSEPRAVRCIIPPLEASSRSVVHVARKTRAITCESRSTVRAGCEDRHMLTEERGFVAWGHVAGVALPSGFRLDTHDGWFELTTDLPDSFRQLKPPGVLQSDLPGGFYVTGVKRQPRVGSQVGFRLSVTAPDSDDAFQMAQDEVLPVYLASVSAVTEHPLYGAVIAVHEDGQDGQWCSRLSSSEVVFIPSPRILEPNELGEVPSLVWAAQLDATARLAAREFQAANMYLTSRTNDLADVQAILSTYYFVLERIAKRLNKDRPLRPDPAEVRDRIEQLQHSLEIADRMDEQVSAVHAAHRDLQGLRGRGMRRGIREAGEATGVADEIVREAVRFSDLRNKKLGHPAPLGDHSQELDEWLPRAQTCAMAYLAAYLRWVDKRGVADPNE